MDVGSRSIMDQVAEALGLGPSIKRELETGVKDHVIGKPPEESLLTDPGPHDYGACGVGWRYIGHGQEAET